MKKIVTFLLILAIIPFVLCSCSLFSDFFGEEITGITLSETELLLTVGESAALEITVEPEEAEAKKLTWTTSDESVATINDGVVKAKKAGSAVIKVEAENGVSGQCNVAVEDKEIEKVTLSNTNATIKEGKTIQLEVSVTPVDALSAELVWNSSDESVATVNNEGYVTGVKAGAAEITCKVQNGVEASCTITVKENVTETDDSTQPSSSSKSTSETSGSESKNNDSSSDDFIISYSSERKITDSEASKLTSEEVQLAINEIYARNGYIFKTESIQSYFESKSWYSPDSSFSTSDLSSIESYNIGVLSKYR